MFMSSKRNVTPNFGWNQSSSRGHVAFVARNCASYSPWLQSIAHSLSLLGMSTLASHPVASADAVDVHCTEEELTVTLADGRRVSAPLIWFPRLLNATSAQRTDWRLIGGGIGIHWEAVDEDISVRSLLTP